MSKHRSKYAGEGPTSPTRRRLYQDRERGVFLGVCAGLADFFGFDVTLVRLITAFGAFLFFPTVLICYFALALLLPKKPPEGDSDDYSQSLRRRVRTSPHSTLDNVRYRFGELDARLQRLEKYLTSNRFKLDQEFESLKD